MGGSTRQLDVALQLESGEVGSVIPCDQSFSLWNDTAYTRVFSPNPHVSRTSLESLRLASQAILTPIKLTRLTVTGVKGTSTLRDTVNL